MIWSDGGISSLKDSIASPIRLLESGPAGGALAISYLSKKRKPMKEVMTVTGRADVSILFNGSLNDINNGVNELKRIKDIVSTETLIEVEVDLGW